MMGRWGPASRAAASSGDGQKPPGQSAVPKSGWFVVCSVQLSMFYTPHARAGSAVAEIQLPGLNPGQKPEELITQYQSGIFTRVTRLSDVRGRIDTIPEAERTSPMVSCLGFLL